MSCINNNNNNKKELKFYCINKKKGSLNIYFNMFKISIINFWDLIYFIIIDFKFILCFFIYIGNFKRIPRNRNRVLLANQIKIFTGITK